MSVANPGKAQRHDPMRLRGGWAPGIGLAPSTRATLFLQSRLRRTVDEVTRGFCNRCGPTESAEPRGERLRLPEQLYDTEFAPIVEPARDNAGVPFRQHVILRRRRRIGCRIDEIRGAARS